MRYLHGKRTTPLYHEMNQLERVISEFEKKARKFHDDRDASAIKSGKDTDDQKSARQADRKSEMDHLKQEAALAKTMAQVQVRIEEYRSAENIVMHAEKHHPTAELENLLRADGRPKPSPKHTAHHIVPGKGKTNFAADARIELHLHNIRINDPDNGVWMLQYKEDKGHWSMPNAHSHKEIHTHNYEKWVFQKISAALDEPDARQILRNVGHLLHEGKQPPQVTMPPQASWNGQ